MYIHTEGTRTSSLCWDCQCAIGPNMCSWAKNFQPVKGWTAWRNDLKSTPTGGLVISYHVEKCPLFIRDVVPPTPQINVSTLQSKKSYYYSIRKKS